MPPIGTVCEVRISEQQAIPAGLDPVPVLLDLVVRDDAHIFDPEGHAIIADSGRWMLCFRAGFAPGNHGLRRGIVLVNGIEVARDQRGAIPNYDGYEAGVMCAMAFEIDLGPRSVVTAAVAQTHDNQIMLRAEPWSGVLSARRVG